MDENKPKTEEQENLFAANSKQPVEEAPALEEDSKEDAEFDRGEEVTTAGFSDKAKGGSEFSKIGVDEDFPEEGMWLKISSIRPGKIFANDDPLESQYGKYYERKLIIEFENEFNDRKLRENMSKVTFSLDEKTGAIGAPRIKTACDEEDMDDQFTQDVAKFRRLYHNAFPEVPEDQSDVDFLAALLNTESLWVKKKGKFKQRGKTVIWAKLVPKEVRPLAEKAPVDAEDKVADEDADKKATEEAIEEAVSPDEPASPGQQALAEANDEPKEVNAETIATEKVTE